jgi:hypothetical protein
MYSANITFHVSQGMFKKQIEDYTLKYHLQKLLPELTGILVKKTDICKDHSFSDFGEDLNSHQCSSHQWIAM